MECHSKKVRVKNLHARSRSPKMYVILLDMKISPKSGMLSIPAGGIGVDVGWGIVSLLIFRNSE